MICLDYDGTLVPIAERPQEAILPEEARRIIRCLSVSDFFTIALISGRALGDIRRQVGIPGLFYVGIHGLEILQPSGQMISFVPEESRITLERLKPALKQKTRSLPGVLIEDKGPVIAFHYRQAPDSTGTALKALLLECQRRNYRSIRMGFGKKVIELRPATATDKGSSVLWIIKHVQKGSQVIYAGDDITDADAFRALKGMGIRIQVGTAKLPEEADYFLRGPSELIAFLYTLHEHCTVAGPCPEDREAPDAENPGSRNGEGT